MTERQTLTTEELARRLGTSAEEIEKAFEENAARFTEGKHYFTLNGKKLWTRRGLAHFAFIIETPEAWAIYKEMERVYLMTMGIK